MFADAKTWAVSPANSRSFSSPDAPNTKRSFTSGRFAS